MSKHALQIVSKIEKAYDCQDLSLNEVAVLRAIAMAAGEESLIASKPISILANFARMDPKTFRKYRNKLTVKRLLCVRRQPRGGISGSRADHHVICWPVCDDENETLAPASPQGKSELYHRGIEASSLGNASPFNIDSSIYTLDKQKKGGATPCMSMQPFGSGKHERRSIPDGLSNGDIEWLQTALPGEGLTEIIIWLWQLETRVGAKALCKGLNRAKKPIEVGNVRFVRPYLEKAALNALLQSGDYQPNSQPGYSVQVF